jgi:ketosteroid isomerase-like protein
MLVRTFTVGRAGTAVRRAIGVAAALALVAFPSTAPGQSAAASSKSAVRELLRLEDGWAAGLVKRDTAMFRRHLAREFVYTENADVMGKEDVLKGVVGSDTVTWAGNEGMRVHPYGTTAVVTGILAMKGRGKDGAFDKRYRFTDTWKLIDGRWQIIAAQDYLIPK